MLKACRDHPDISVLKNKVFAVAIVIDPIRGSPAFEDQPSLVMVMKMLLAIRQFEALVQEPLV
jgi:hypothetical protein